MLTRSSETCGILYIARGTAHLDAARHSAISARRHNPHLDIAVFHDSQVNPVQGKNEGEGYKEFDQVFAIPPDLVRAKIELLPRSPFMRTLYLDNDTRVRANLDSMFDLLDRFDLCGAHVALWHRPRHNKQCGDLSVPDSFPEINCGVLLYRSSTTERFFNDWANLYVKAGLSVDQPSFRATLWHSDIRFNVLPAQFNKRVFEASELIYSEQPRPRILHMPILRPHRDPLRRWMARRLG